MIRTKFAAFGIAAALAVSLGAGATSASKPASAPATATSTAPATTATTAAAAPTHESIRMSSIPLLGELIEILKTVKDDGSSKAAVTQLDAIGKKMAVLKADDDKLPKMSDAEESALDTKLREKAGTMLVDLEKEMGRIAALDPAISKPVIDAMDKAMP